MENKLQKALKLSHKTGDRLIVFDAAYPATPFVVMMLEDYEKIIIGKSDVRGLTEDELLDKINRDIAIWKSEQEHLGDYGNKERLGNDFLTKKRDYFQARPKRKFTPRGFAPIEDIIDDRPRLTDLDQAVDFEVDDIYGDDHDDFFDENDWDDDFDPGDIEIEPEPILKRRGNPWKIPEERKQAAEEIIDEDRQYLEAV